MKYDFEKSYDCQKAKEYLNKLIKDKSIAELKKINPKRTIPQNSYLHVLISLWGIHHGYLLEEAKQVIKEQLGYTYEKKGRIFYMPTSKMKTGELTIFIDKFRDWSNITCEFYLPTSTEHKIDYVRISNEIKDYY
jgi:hypothetical protein